MKHDIHPDYVVTQVTCTCGSPFTTRSTVATAPSTPTCARSATRSTRQAEDPRHRRSRGPLRGALRQEGRCREEVAPPRSRHHQGRGRRRACSRQSTRSSPSTPPSSGGWPTRRRTPTSGSPKRLNQRYAELTAVVRAYQEWQQVGDDLAAARELAGEDAAFAAEADELATRRAGVEERLQRQLVPRDPTDGKDAILEVKAGEGGEESALFAGDLLRMYTRYAERRGWKTEVLDATESDLGGYKSVTLAVKAKGTSGAGRGAVRPAQVRGRRAPRPAGAGHRVAGPRPHLGRGRAGDARGRAGRRDRRRERPAHRRLPVLRPRRPERQHHRLGRPDHPPAHRHRRELPEREVPAPEQGAGDAHPAGPAARRRPGRRRRRGQPRPGGARSAPSTAPSASAPTTIPRTASPTTARATRPTTSTRCSTATSSRCSPRRSRPTWRRAWSPSSERPARPPRRSGRRPSSGSRRPASPRRRFDADELLAHVLGTTRAGSPSSTPSRPSRPRRTTPWWPARAAREPLQHLTGSAAFRHVELAVGPGVFVPRPETELLAGWAVEQAAPLAPRRSWSTSAPAPAPSPRRSPTRCPTRASTRSSSTTAPTPGPSATSPAPASTCGWATWPTAFDDLLGTVDVVVCNPPYVPLEAWESVAAEARDHDPAPGALLRARRARRDPRPRAARGGSAEARGSGGLRARRRAGRVGAGRVRDHRSVARGSRPPGPGRASALDHRPAGTMSAL